jgi:hypothetical protein
MAGRHERANFSRLNELLSCLLNFFPPVYLLVKIPRLTGKKLYNRVTVQTVLIISAKSQNDKNSIAHNSLLVFRFDALSTIQNAGLGK